MATLSTFFFFSKHWDSPATLEIGKSYRLCCTDVVFWSYWTCNSECANRMLQHFIELFQVTIATRLFACGRPTLDDVNVFKNIFCLVGGKSFKRPPKGLWKNKRQRNNLAKLKKDKCSKEKYVGHFVQMAQRGATPVKDCRYVRLMYELAVACVLTHLC